MAQTMTSALRRACWTGRTAGLRGLSASVTPATLPDMPYGYGELEPAISGVIMELHHSKHHATYVANYNKAVEQLGDALAAGDVAKVAAAQSAINFNGGGHINHSIFWNNLAPTSKGGGEYPKSGALITQIKSDFGDIETMVSRLNAMTAAIQGSGWGWLAYHPAEERLVLTTRANQDPLTSAGLVPLLGIDVWEHAYYLQYKNARPSYLREIWSVVNWADVAKRYEDAKA